MKHRLVERVLMGLLLVVAAGIVVHAPLTVWLGTIWPHGNEVVKAWKEILTAIALVLLVAVAIRKKQFNVLMNDRLMQVALLYAGLHFVMIGVLNTDLHQAGAGILIDLRYVLYFVVVYGALQLYPHYRRLFVQVFAWGAVVVVGFGLLQIFVLPADILAHIGYSKATIAPYLTIDKNQSYVRINSTLRGPNPLGAYAMAVLSMMLAYVLRYYRKLQSLQLLWLALGAIGAALVLGASYSRSADIALVVAVLATVLVVARQKARQRLVAATIAVLVVASVGLYMLRDTHFVSNVVLHINPSGGSSVNSNEGHAESLVDGVRRLVVQPLGQGVGSTGSASLDTKNALIIENQYLFIAHEVGWAGLALFLWLFGLVMARLWQRRASAFALGTFATGCGLAVVGLLLPVWTDDTVSIVWWGMAAVALATGARIKKR